MLFCPWDFPGKNTGVGCHFLFQGIFVTQGSNLCLLHCRLFFTPEPLALLGNSLEVHWLGLCTFTADGPLAGELRYSASCAIQPEKKKIKWCFWFP